MRPRSSVLTLCRQAFAAGRHGSTLRWIRRAALPVMGMVLVSCVVSALVAMWLTTVNQRTMAHDVHHLVERCEQRFNDYAQVAVGVRSFWAVHQPLRHEDLAMYVAGLDLTSRYPGVQTVNVSELVPPDQEGRFDARQRQAWAAYTHGQIVFTRHGSTVLGDHTVRNFLDNGPSIGSEVITYLEPWQSFPYAVGRDLTQDPAMAAALRMARDQNVAMAGSVIMGHTLRGEVFPGLGIRLPLYQGANGTVDERRQHYAGSVGIGVRLDQFFNRVLTDNNLQYLDMQVFTIPTENSAPASLQRWLVYDSRHPLPNAPFSLVTGRWVHQETLNLEGYRVWAVFANHGAPPNAYSPLWSVIAGVITFATLLVLWVLMESAVSARRRAVQLTRMATQDLQKQQAMTEQAAQMAGVGHWQLDVTHNRLTLSHKAQEILGFPHLPMHPKTWSEQLDPDDRLRWKAWFNDLISATNNQDQHLEYRYRRGDEVVWLSIVGRRVDSGKGAVALQGSLMDISQRKRNELDLRLKHRLGSIATVQEGTLDRGAKRLDDPLRHRSMFNTFVQRLAEELNMVAARFWVYSAVEQRFEIQGTWVSPSLPSFTKVHAFDGWSDPDWQRADAAVPASCLAIAHRPEQALSVRMDWPVQHEGQATAWLELYDVHRRDALVSDLQEPFIQQAIGQEAIHLVHYHAHYTHLHYLAGTDPLTGLMNRYRFGEALRERMDCSEQGLAVLFIDLDGFKKVNDSLGHAAGDQVLQQMAQRFRACLAPHDMIGRMGGDEFAVLTTTNLLHDNVLGNCADPEPVNLLAQRLLKACETPFRIQNQPCFLSASIGIAMMPDDGAVAGDIIKRADIAMYAVKKTGKNGHQRYTPVQEKAAVLRNEMEAALKEAVTNRQMSLEYQPKFRIKPGKAPCPSGVESLLRWNHPTLGRISPDTFIALAEENGDIHALGQWVMHAVLEQMRRWDAQGLTGLTAAVNFSPRQFKDETSLNACLDQVAQAGVSPRRITLEITEGCLMESPERSRLLLHRLHEQGFRIAIDDFGMGYSSLAYLKTFPVDEIKIDKTFVQNMENSPQDVAIVDAILHMARRLGMEVVAEGVETFEQLSLLQDMGCSLFQGFLLSRPLPAHQIPDRWQQPLDLGPLPLLLAP